jgi:putative hydrolase of HD superfamily
MEAESSEPSSASTAGAPAPIPLDEQSLATIAFFMELDRLKTVERRNHLADGSRRENTAEHSWHLGMAALVFAGLATEPIDVGRAVAMALTHDIVEIDAGDTFAYDQGAELASKVAREQAAADRIFGLLPEPTGRYLRELWDEYERGDTAEARYVMAIDRMAPMLLNLAEGGTTWREHGITRDRVIARNGPHVEPSLPTVWAHALALLDAFDDAAPA